MKFSIFDINNLSVTEFEKWYTLMSSEKQSRVDAMSDIKDKKRTVCGEMLVRTMISTHTDLLSENIKINTDKYGKPYVDNLDIEFNISHSENLVVCVICEQPIGIDIQKIEDINPKVALKYFSDDEFKYVFGCNKQDFPTPYLPDKSALMRYFEVWTRREAMAKCSGLGLFKHNFNIEYNLTTIFLDEYVISIAK